VRGQLHTIVALSRYISSVLHFKEGYLGSIASLDGSGERSFLCPCGERSFLCPCWETNSNCPVKRAAPSLLSSTKPVFLRYWDSKFTLNCSTCTCLYESLCLCLRKMRHWSRHRPAAGEVISYAIMPEHNNWTPLSPTPMYTSKLHCTISYCLPKLLSYNSLTRPIFSPF